MKGGSRLAELNEKIRVHHLFRDVGSFSDVGYLLWGLTHVIGAQ